MPTLRAVYNASAVTCFSGVRDTWDNYVQEIQQFPTVTPRGFCGFYPYDACVRPGEQRAGLSETETTAAVVTRWSFLPVRAGRPGVRRGEKGSASSVLRATTVQGTRVDDCKSSMFRDGSARGHRKLWSMIGDAGYTGRRGQGSAKTQEAAAGQPNLNLWL